MKKYGIFFLTSICVYSLDQSPWLGDVYQFNLDSMVAYSHYRYINHAKEQPTYTYRNYVTKETLSFTASENLELEMEIELARTPHQLYGFRSSAMQARYRLLDDIAGDPLSLTLGASLRGVGGRSVRDVSSPYSSYLNAEVMFSLGKEFTKTTEWTSRGYLAGLIGLANHGSVWNRVEANFEGKFFNAQVIKAFMAGYFGYGPKTLVNINHFHGWREIAHRSIDLGAQYRYCFPRWGDLGLSYAYRVFARSYPQNEQRIELSYYLPFSLF
ncbi:MAG: hypothetical protein JSS09_06515 [Verrucomicrobia bacterium]|nr:hypothetical protein [Verrucomicrobiota bacterium]